MHQELFNAVKPFVAKTVISVELSSALSLVKYARQVIV